MSLLARALPLATLWLSPAALLSLGPLLLADGTGGLWAPLALGAGAVVTALLLAEPATRHAGLAEGPAPVVRWRWPASWPALIPLALGEGLGALLFVWAQLAASREVAEALGGWPRPIVVLFTAGLVAAVWHDRPGDWLARAGAVVAGVGFALPLAAVLAATTPAWPRVWAEVASRPRVTFTDRSVWTTKGRPLHDDLRAGPTLTVPEEQRVTLLGRGRVRIEAWEGGESRRDVVGETELTLRPGDRLTASEGLLVRFETGRRVPNAPATGSDWVDPPGRRRGVTLLAGLAVTCLFGALGLPGIHAALRGAPGLPSRIRSLRLAAGLVVLGAGASTLWALYAAWLTPGVYVGGVTGVEIYELPGNLPALRGWGGPLRLLALGGLGAGVLAAGLLALAGLPRRLPVRRRPSRVVVVAVAAGAGLCAVVMPAGPWPVLVAALGLSAATGAPGVVLACWSERATPRAVGLGAAVGLALFSLLSVAALVARAGGTGLPEAGPLGWALAWPVLVALPANALVAWLTPARPAPSPRSPLPPGLAELHE